VIEHGPVRVAEIPPIRELANVFPRVLRRDMNVRSTDCTLQQAPMTLHSVGVVNAVDPNFLIMIDAPVIEAKVAQTVISAPFVCTNNSALSDIMLDDVFEVSPAQIIDRTGTQIAVALNHAHDDRLVVTAPTAISHLLLASDLGLINLDMAGKRSCVIRAGHKFSKFVAKAPRALIGNARLTFDFLRRNAMARAGHQVHSEKPDRQLCRRLMEDRPGAWINMVTTFLTGKTSPLAHWIKIGKRPAAWAMNVRPAEIDFHQLREARRVVWIFRLELFEGVFGHG